MIKNSKFYLLKEASLWVLRKIWDFYFFMIDKTEIYHIGASLKDLGKKWFAFSKFDKKYLEILSKLKEKEEKSA